MVRPLPVFLALLAAAVLFPLTGVVLRRHAATARFVRARDLLERGEDRRATLAALAAGGAWEAGPYRLTREPGGDLRLFERWRHGWREVR